MTSLKFGTFLSPFPLKIMKCENSMWSQKLYDVITSICLHLRKKAILKCCISAKKKKIKNFLALPQRQIQFASKFTVLFYLIMTVLFNGQNSYWTLEHLIKRWICNTLCCLCHLASYCLSWQKVPRSLLVVWFSWSKLQILVVSVWKKA